MTRPRYLIARLGQAFGISLTGRYSTSAAAEMHLLRESEEILGRISWESLEEFDDLSVEYWNLRRMSKEHLDLIARIEEANATIEKSHEARAGMLEKVADSTKDLVEEREKLIEQSERLGAERDAILRDARTIKRRHDGLTSKLEVLTEELEADAPQVTATSAGLDDLREEFRTLRNRRDKLTEQIRGFDEAIEELDLKIDARREKLRSEAFDSYHDVGKTNRDLSRMRSELGVIEGEMADLFSEIGHYLSIRANAEVSEDINHRHRSLISQMQALRASINMNNKLAGKETLLME